MDWGLPYHWNSDEKLYQAVHMLFRRSLDPDYFVNPSLHTYTLLSAVAFAQAVYPNQGLQLFPQHIAPMTDPAHLSRPLQFLAMRMVRGVSVLAALLTVCILYRAGRRHFNEATGLLSAAFLACTMGFVNMAHFATVESLLILLVVLALVSIDRVITPGGARAYAIAGALVGLAASTKYTAVLLGVPLVAAHLLGRGWQEGCRPRAVGLLLLSGLTVVLAFVAGTPYAVINWERFVREGILYSWFTGAPSGTLFSVERSWDAYAAHLANIFGLPLFVLTLFGVAFAAIQLPHDKTTRAHRACSVHLVWILVFYGFCGLNPHNALRFITPIVPSLVLLAAAAVVHMMTRMRRPAFKWAGATIVALSVAYSTAYVVTADLMFLRDPRYEAGAWLSRQRVVQEQGLSHFTIDAYLPFFDRPSFPIWLLPFVDDLRVRGKDFWQESSRYLAGSTELIVDADLYYLRFFGDNFFGTAERKEDRAKFYQQIFVGAHPSGYRVVKRFELRNHRWLDPRPEKVAPLVVVFGKPGSVE